MYQSSSSIIIQHLLLSGKHIGASVYLITVVVIITVSALSVSPYNLNLQFNLSGFVLIFTTSLVLCILFLPKVRRLFSILFPIFCLIVRRLFACCLWFSFVESMPKDILKMCSQSTATQLQYQFINCLSTAAQRNVLHFK